MSNMNYILINYKRISYILDNRKSLNKLFRQYMSKSKNNEIIDFIEMVNLFEHLPDDSKRYRLATTIMNNYIRTNSKFEINISNVQKKLLCNNFDQYYNKTICPIDMFLMVKKDLIFGLKEDQLPIFMNSDPVKCYLFQKMTDKKTGVKIKNRSYRLKVYRNCFLGCDLVTWILKNMNVSNRRSALKVGNKIFDNKWFIHVCNNHRLKDKPLYYKFIVHIQNNKVVKKKESPRFYILSPKSFKKKRKKKDKNLKKRIQSVPRSNSFSLKLIKTGEHFIMKQLSPKRNFNGNQ